MSLTHDTAQSPADLRLPASAAEDELPTLRPPAAGWELLTPAARSLRCRQLADQGYLVARIVAAGDGACAVRPGGLDEAIASAVEISLALRGAAPATASDDEGLPCAREQVARVAALGARGLCVVLPALRRLAGHGGALDPRDSAALRAWKALAEEQAVVVLVDDGDRGVAVQVPMAIDALLVPPPRPARLPGWPEDARSLAGEADDGESAALAHPSFPRALPSETGERPTIPDGRRPAAQTSLFASDAPTAAGSVMRDDPLAGLDDDMAPIAQASLFEDPTRDVVAGGGHLLAFAEPSARPMRRAVSSPAPAAERAPRGEKPSKRRGPGLRQRKGADREGSPPPAPRAFDAPALRGHAAALGEARGARPVKQIEQAFAAHYAPLCEALACGFDDREAERALCAWRAAFEKSYAEGYSAMRLTGKRPRMVLDAPEQAILLGKQHGARAVQLVLVDAMRFDLGARARDKFGALVAGRAGCVGEQLLWAALPTTTAVQMQLLAAGPRGLAELDPPSDDPAVYRDATAATPRRERIGRRDLLKIDAAEARLRDSGGPFHERMDALAAEIAGALAGVAAELPARTLMYVFGDHGFFMRNIGPDRTARAEQGGARPEEVLCGGYAWLISS